MVLRFVGDDDLSMLSQIGSKVRLTDLSTQFMRLCMYTCMDGICLSLRLLNSAPAEAEGSYVRCGLRLVSSSMTSAISKQFQSTLLTVELSSVTGLFLFQPQVQMNPFFGGGGFLVLLQLFSAAYSPLQYNLEAYSPLILRIRKLPRMARC